MVILCSFLAIGFGIVQIILTVEAATDAIGEINPYVEGASVAISRIKLGFFIYTFEALIIILTASVILYFIRKWKPK